MCIQMYMYVTCSVFSGRIPSLSHFIVVCITAKESTRQSMLTLSDTPAPTGTLGVVEHSHLSQHDSTTSAVGSVISPLVHSDDVPPQQPPSQAPSLPIVFQVPSTRGGSADGIPLQTPIAAPRTASSLQWAQFTTPAQPASDKDSTGQPARKPLHWLHMFSLSALAGI